MNFIKDLFTWKGRWNRLKFWIYPLVSIILILPIVGAIAYMSLSGYSEDAKNTKISADIMTISIRIQIEIENSMGKTLESFKKEDNKINFNELGLNEEDFKMPNGGDYLIFTKDDQFEIYGETSNSVIIKGNYYPKNETDPVSLVLIDGKYKQNGDLIQNSYNSNSGKNTILTILAGIIYIAVIWILIVTYIKRLHDLNKSGWIVLISFIPFVNIGLLIYCGFFKGTEGENRFGPNPLDLKTAKNKPDNSIPNEL